MKLELRMPQNISQSAFASPCGGPGNPCPPPSLSNPCGDCSGERSYNATNFQPDCGFAGSPKPDQTPTKNKQPYMNLVLQNQNTDTIPPPLAGTDKKGIGQERLPFWRNQQFGKAPESSFNYKENPLKTWNPTTNPNPEETMTYRQGKPCPPAIHTIPTQYIQYSDRKPQIPSRKSNGTNPCERSCGPKISGETWNNTRTPQQTMQLFHLPVPIQDIQIGKGPSGDQPILTTNLRRSSVMPDDKCIPTYTTGSQYTQRPTEQAKNYLPSQFTQQIGELGSVL